MVTDTETSFNGPPLVGAAEPGLPPGWSAPTGYVEPLLGFGTPSALGYGSGSAAPPPPSAERPSPGTLHLALRAAAPAGRLFVSPDPPGLGGEKQQLCSASAPPAAG